MVELFQGEDDHTIAFESENRMSYVFYICHICNIDPFKNAGFEITKKSDCDEDIFEHNLKP